MRTRQSITWFHPSRVIPEKGRSTAPRWRLAISTRTDARPAASTMRRGGAARALRGGGCRSCFVHRSADAFVALPASGHDATWSARRHPCVPCGIDVVSLGAGSVAGSLGVGLAYQGEGSRAVVYVLKHKSTSIFIDYVTQLLRIDLEPSDCKKCFSRPVSVFSHS